MDFYIFVKTIHILSSTVLFGTGIGIAFFMFRSWRASCIREKYYAAKNVVLAVIGLVSLSTLFLQERYWQRWISFPNILFCMPVPLLVAYIGLRFMRGLEHASNQLPFILTQGLFLLGFLGLTISFFPYIVPPDISIWQAAAPYKSLSFLLVGAVIIIPVILMYTAWGYWVFRGKVGVKGYQ